MLLVPPPSLELVVTDSSDVSTSSRPVSAIWPDLSLLGVALIWGVNVPLMKVGLDRVAGFEFAFNALRLAISALVLLALALREKAPPISRPPGLWKSILLYAVIASGVYQWTFLLGLSQTRSGNGALIMATVPAWTAVLARVFLKERLSRLSFSGLLVAWTGTLIVALQKGLSGDREELWGNIAMLLAALSWAGATVQSRQVLPYVSPLRLSAIASVLMLPLHFVLGGTSLAGIAPLLPEPQVWGPLLYAGGLSTGVALAMWNYGVGHSGAAHAAVFQNLVPVVALLSAWLIRNEPVTNPQLVGGALIITGVILMRRGRRVL